MESAALFFVASTIGVMFGWQPMPDGSEKVEYIVQIEPELARTLRDGQSIPITSDVPDDIGPIGRIRIVVGSDDLPKQTLTTRFKPWPTKESRDGLVETQFTVPPVQSSGADRYGTQPASNNEILPPDSGVAAQNPFGRALQQGAQQARQAANDAQDQILPPADEIFGNGGTTGQGVRNAVNDTTNQLRQGFNRNVEQVADRTGQQLRNAVDGLGRNAQDAVNQFGQSLGSQPADNQRSILNNGQTQNSSTILPPGSENADQFAAPKRRIDEPVDNRQPQRQLPQAPPASFAQGGNNPNSQAGVFNAPWPPVDAQLPSANTASNTPPPSNYGNQNNPPPANSQWPSQQNNNPPPGRDPFDIASNPAQQQPGGNSDRYGGYNNASNSGSNNLDGPQFPSSPNQNTPSQQTVNNNWPQQQQPAPEIRRDMMNQPQDNKMQTVGTDAQGYNSQGYQQQSVARQPLGTQPQDFGWPQNNQQAGAQETAGAGGSTTLFPLLLSWVLLSGSGAGNLYLFWSYLDVRNKYHGIVHGYNGRRDRYDD